MRWFRQDGAVQMQQRSHRERNGRSSSVVQETAGRERFCVPHTQGGWKNWEVLPRRTGDLVEVVRVREVGRFCG